MRLTEFHQLIADEFGDMKGKWITHSHVVSAMRDTPEALIEDGADLKELWLALCDDFDIPESRRLGMDR